MNIYERIAKIERALRALHARSFITYDKGTYQPVYEGNVTPGVTTYTIQNGYWRQLGDAILFDGRVTWTAATGTGTATITLPFTTGAQTHERGGVMLYTINVTFANGSIQGRYAPGDNRFFLSSPITNGANTDTAVEAAGDVIFSGLFFLN